MNEASVLQAGIKEGIKELKETMGHVREDFMDNLSDARSSLARSAGKLSRKARHAGEMKLLDLEKSVESSVKKHPFRILAGAFGVGLAVGWLGGWFGRESMTGR